MDYNKEPVEYCLACHKLRLIDVNGKPLCLDCGAMNYTSYCSIDDWKKDEEKLNQKIKS